MSAALPSLPGSVEDSNMDKLEPEENQVVIGGKASVSVFGAAARVGVRAASPGGGGHLDSVFA